MEITVNKDGQDLGPYSLEDLQAELATGNISQEDHAWYEGCEDWISVADIPGVEEEQPTEKICPRCAETIKFLAVVCRYCGHEYESVKSNPPNIL